MKSSFKTWIGSGQLWYCVKEGETAQVPIRGVGYTKEAAIIDYLHQLTEHVHLL